MSIDVVVESVPIEVTVQDQAPVTVQVYGVQVTDIHNATPSSASDTGTAGTVTYDSSYLYVCIATDTWKRIALTTWP